MYQEIFFLQRLSTTPNLIIFISIGFNKQSNYQQTINCQYNRKINYNSKLKDKIILLYIARLCFIFSTYMSITIYYIVSQQMYYLYLAYKYFMNPIIMDFNSIYKGL